MKLAIVTEKAALSHYKVAQDIYNALKTRVECHVYDWEEQTIPEPNILFVGTILCTSLHYLSRFMPHKKVVFYTTLEGEPLIDPIARKIADNIKIVANSQFSRSLLTRSELHCDDVVYHGINMRDNQYDPAFTEFLETIQHAGKEKVRKRKYLTVSANSPRKGLDRAMLAHRLVEYGNKDAIYILHSGGGFVDVRKVADDLELTPTRFWFTNSFGMYNEFQMNSLYRFSDFYVQPSFTEGLGLPMIEALKWQKPVIAINAPPYNEIIEHKVTGYLIPVTGESRQLYLNRITLLMRLYSVNALAEAIEIVLDDKYRDKLSKNITDQVKMRFEAEKTYPALLKHFE